MTKIIKNKPCVHNRCIRKAVKGKYCSECLQLNTRECNFCGTIEHTTTFKEFVKVERRSKWIKVFSTILIMLGIFGVYLLGVNHGAMRTAFAIGSEHCELMDGMMPIYPYGCEHNDSTDNYCIDMNCQAIDLGFTGAYDNNGAVCLHLNSSDVQQQKISAFFIGWGLTGCPLQLHTIGLNKFTGNRNWVVNKVEMQDWNGTVME